MNSNTAASFFIVKAADSFGDVWPLSISQGIDDIRHATLEAAKAVTGQWKADKSFRKACRERCGWQPNSIRALHVEEVKVT